MCALRYGPGKGYGELVTRLATEAGQAEAAKAQKEMDFRQSLQREAQDFQRQSAIEQFSRELAANRERMRMQQDFELEKIEIERQTELAAFARAKSWEIEKMELASRIDFEKELKQKELAELKFNARRNSLQDGFKKGQLSEEELMEELDNLERAELAMYIGSQAASFLKPAQTLESVTERMDAIKQQRLQEYRNSVMNSDLPADQKLAILNRVEGEAAGVTLPASIARPPKQDQPSIVDKIRAHKELGNFRENYVDDGGWLGKSKTIPLAVRDPETDEWRPATTEEDQLYEELKSIVGSTPTRIEDLQLPMAGTVEEGIQMLNDPTIPSGTVIQLSDGRKIRKK